MFLTQRVGQGLAVLVERPAEHSGDDRSLLESWLGRTAFPLGVTDDKRQDLAAVLDVREFVAGEFPVALGWDWLPGIGKLGVPPQAVVEKSEHALVVIEPKRPVEHLAGRIDDADPLGLNSGPADLAVEPAFRIVG